MLSVQHLAYSYPGHRVLQDVSFTLGQGELIFLLGANGAGKSTMFGCLLGHLPGWQGEIQVDDRPARSMTARELARKIAYIPQSHHPTFSYPAEDMVLMGTSSALPVFGVPGEKERSAARRAMEQVGIEGLAQRDFQTLSGGEQQMVLIARALAQQGKILLMDEPTANLDYGNQTRVLELIRSLADEGYTILLSCHDPQLALLYADRVIALHEGRILADAPPEEAITPELIQKLYRVSVRFVPTTDGALLAPAKKNMAQWQPDMVRFMEDAASRTGFFHTVAEELAALVPAESRVCDAGCGLGFTSLELAKRFRSVRAVDLSADTLEKLRRRNTCGNLEIICADVFSMTPEEKYDAMLFCRFGHTKEILRAARNQCRGTVLVVQKEARYHRLTAQKQRNRKADFSRIEEEFSRLGIPFQSKRLQLDMGQPLHSLEDGVRFFRTYDRSADLSHITTEYVKERVIATDDPEFPYFYPMETTVGFLSFRAEDVPAL